MEGQGDFREELERQTISLVTLAIFHAYITPSATRKYQRPRITF